MCSPADANKIRAEVGQWMQRGKMFTSVDIANSLKQRGDWVRNRDVADYLRTNVVNISPQYGCQYKTTVINVTLPNGSNTEATLYHPEGSSPSTYTKTNQKALSPDEAKNDTPFNATADDSSDEKSDPYFEGVATLRAFEPKPEQVINVHIEHLSIESMTMIVSPDSDVRIMEEFDDEED